VCEQLLREAELPVLGVCLGHQGLAHVSGAEVPWAPPPINGAPFFSSQARERSFRWCGRLVWRMGW
jgi:para-aminobenzoate synthetase